MSSSPCLVRTVSGAGEVRYSLGHRLVDRYLEFVAGRSRPNTSHARFRTKADNGLVRVLVTRILADGAMLRRVVDTARRSDGRNWEDLADRALAYPPPYRPVPGADVDHISVDHYTVEVAEYDLAGALRDLVAVVLAMGEETSGP